MFLFNSLAWGLNGFSTLFDNYSNIYNLWLAYWDTMDFIQFFWDWYGEFNPSNEPWYQLQELPDDVETDSLCGYYGVKLPL